MEHMNQNRYMTYCVEQFPETPKNVVTAKSIKTKNCYVIGLIGVHALPRAGFWWDQQYRQKEYVSEAMKAWVQMYWHRYPNGHPSLLRMETWVLWAKTKSEDARSRTVMEKSGFVDVGKRVVGVVNNRRLADHWILLKP
jgi:RimJ/RimL family protein N-acetyltransferase